MSEVIILLIKKQATLSVLRHWNTFFFNKMKKTLLMVPFVPEKHLQRRYMLNGWGSCLISLSLEHFLLQKKKKCTRAELTTYRPINEGDTPGNLEKLQGFQSMNRFNLWVSPSGHFCHDLPPHNLWLSTSLIKQRAWLLGTNKLRNKCIHNWTEM